MDGNGPTLRHIIKCCNVRHIVKALNISRKKEKRIIYKGHVLVGMVLSQDHRLADLSTASNGTVSSEF